MWIMRTWPVVTWIGQGRAASRVKKGATRPVGSTVPFNLHCWWAAAATEQCRPLVLKIVCYIEVL